jgi:hypothetical protein
MFQRFKVTVNNMRTNVVILPCDDHDRAIKLLHYLDRPCGVRRSRPFLSRRSMRPSWWTSCFPSLSCPRWTVSYGPPWANCLGGYQDRLLGGPLGLLCLCHTAPDGVGRKDYGGEVLG